MEIPAACAITLLLLALASDGTVGFADGVVLLLLFTGFLWYTYRLAKERGEVLTSEEYHTKTFLRSAFEMMGGLTLLSLGGLATVHGATDIAEAVGISQRIIGLTIVAIGTSLPELFTSAVAAYRRQADIAIGNVVGSNIFNILWILGVSSLIRPLPFTRESVFDGAVALGSVMLLLIALLVGRRGALERWQGMVFILLYAAYLCMLIFAIFIL